MKSIPALRAVASVGLAGAVGLSALPGATATEDFTFDRIAGADRFATSALLAEAYEGGATAILVNGEKGKYADALSANYLSGALDAPILLTRLGATPPAVLELLEDTGVEDVVVVGGEAVVSAGQVEELEKAGYAVTRVSGDDRYLTNAAVIAEGDHALDGLGLIAAGQGFADALSGGPLSYQGHPLGLSRQDRVDAPVIAALKGAGVDSVYVLGGPNVVSDDVVAQLKAEGITVVDRLSGKDRSATSAAVADRLIADHGFSPDSVNVASGDAAFYGADALSGGPLTGLMNRVLLVTNRADDPAAVTAFLEDSCASLTEGLIFGGEVALSLAAEEEMEAAAQSCEAPDVTDPVLTDASATVQDGTITATVTATDDVEIADVTAALLDAEGATLATTEATAGEADLYTATFADVAPGSYTVAFTATDTSDNTVAVSTATVTVADVTAPVLTDAAALASEDIVTATVTVSDDAEVESVTAVLLDGEGAEVGSENAAAGEDGVYTVTFTSVEEGTYTVRFTATDTSDNAGTATTAPVVVDLTAPVLADAAATADGDTVTTTVTATDEVELADVTVTLLDDDGAEAGTSQATAGDDNVFTAAFTQVADGTYTVRWTATDSSDNTTETTATVVVDTSLKIGQPYVGDDGLTVTLNSLTVVERTGSFQYTINYTLLNETSGAIDEGTWKAYDLDGGEPLPQYGMFGRLFPGDTRTRSYTFEEEKAVRFDVVAYHSDQFFADTPPSGALVWNVPDAQ